MARDGGLLLETHAESDEAAPVHDGSIHGHAAADDGLHDAASELHVDEAFSVRRMGSRPPVCRAKPNRFWLGSFPDGDIDKRAFPENIAASLLVLNLN